MRISCRMSANKNLVMRCLNNMFLLFLLCNFQSFFGQYSLQLETIFDVVGKVFIAF